MNRTGHCCWEQRVSHAFCQLYIGFTTARYSGRTECHSVFCVYDVVQPTSMHSRPLEFKATANCWHFFTHEVPYEIITNEH